MANYLKSATVDLASTASGYELATLLGLRDRQALVKDFYLKPATGNTGECFIGDASGQVYPIGTEFKSPNSMSMRGEERWDLTKVYLKPATNGNDVHVVWTVG